MHNKLLFLTALIVCSLSINAQHTDVDAIRAQAWPDGDPYATLTKIPSKWKDASAVIIYQSYQRAYTKKGKTIRNANSLRKRLKIQDNSALEAFSEFGIGTLDSDRETFRKKSDFLVGEIKIIKPNGKSFLINLDEAVDDGDGGKKVALGNLEVGDIIDYYYYQHEAFHDVKGHAFQPVISTLGEEYPIMHQDLGFKVNKKFYVKFNTYNGAPEVVTTDNPEDETVTYMIQDQDREAEEHIQWFQPNRALPTIKFQVIQANTDEELNGLKVFTKFHGSKLKQDATDLDIIDLAKRSFTITKLKDKGLDSYVYDNCKACDLETKLKMAYHYLRFDRFVDMYEKFSYLEAGMDLHIYDYGNTVMNEVQFINVMAGYLLKENIDFEILATVPKRFGTIGQVLLADEITYIIKVINGDQPIYLNKFTSNTAFNQIPYEIQGQVAIVISHTNTGLSLKSFTHETEMIPVAPAKENMSHGISFVSWNDNSIEKVNIKRRAIMTGHNKDFDRSELVTIHNIIDEETTHLRLGDVTSRMGKKNAKAEIFKNNLTADIQKSKEYQKEQFEVSTSAEYDFELEDYKNAELLNTGRWDGPFEYKDEFSTSDLVKKAGKNYIFEIGKLIGKQMAIDDDQIDRKYDIHMAFTRSFKEEIIVEIPVGYKVQGIDRLNVTVSNSTGQFISTAEVRDDKLYLNTIKEYRNTSEPVSNWASMLEFLEAAYELSQEKILLKKLPNTTSAFLGSK